VEVTNCADPTKPGSRLTMAPMRPCGPTATRDGAGSAARTQVLPSDETQTAGTDTAGSFGIGAAYVPTAINRVPSVTRPGGVVRCSLAMPRKPGPGHLRGRRPTLAAEHRMSGRAALDEDEQLIAFEDTLDDVAVGRRR
jgi:hypothetical protein